MASLCETLSLAANILKNGRAKIDRIPRNPAFKNSLRVIFLFNIKKLLVNRGNTQNITLNYAEAQFLLPRFSASSVEGGGFRVFPRLLFPFTRYHMVTKFTLPSCNIILQDHVSTPCNNDIFTVRAICVIAVVAWDIAHICVMDAL